MPKHKDLKRIVRSRMQKTGESYAAARLQVLKKKPSRDYAATAGMSDAAVKKQTGRTWQQWVDALDAVRASEKPHGEIVTHISSLGVPGWWSQMVTVGYERIRGLRDKGQRRGGLYEAGKSRTFAVPIARLYGAFANARIRERWLPRSNFKVRTSQRNKTMRLSWDDDTLVQFYFTSKGAKKSSVTIQHQKLRDKAAAEKTKAFWGEKLKELSKVLAQ